jgi:hypothetical protein
VQARTHALTLPFLGGAGSPARARERERERRRPLSYSDGDSPACLPACLPDWKGPWRAAAGKRFGSPWKQRRGEMRFCGWDECVPLHTAKGSKEAGRQAHRQCQTPRHSRDHATLAQVEFHEWRADDGRRRAGCQKCQSNSSLPRWVGQTASA